ncbi:phospholipid carrier-dependent glycosyltransferase, partial [Candidatus Sumerlaeota bacterium]|nr:phospholipid carrier-dependent glycosyltransferase [Candidatus Sumerlaeota bacterium]
GESPPIYFSLAIGIMAFSYGTFFFLIKTPLRYWLLLIVAIFIVIVVLKETGNFFRYFDPSRLNSPHIQSIGIIDIVLVLSILILLLPPLLEVFTPPYSWDALVYHLTVPRIYLEHQGFGYIPLNIYSNMPMNIDMLYLVCLRFFDDVVAKMLHCALGLLLGLVLINFSRHHLKSWRPGAVAMIILLTNPMVNYEYGVAFIDVGMAFFMGMAFYATIKAMTSLERRARFSWLILSGLFCGFLTGAKYTGVFSAGAILAILLIGVVWKRKLQFPINTKTLSTAAVIILVCVSLLTLPWLIKNSVFTGNPVYPMFYRLFDGKDWSEYMARQLIDWQHSIGQGRTVIDYLLLPIRIFTISKYDYKHFAGPMSPAILLAFVVSLLFCQRAHRRWFWLLVAGFVGFFIPWSLGAQQVRFLIPALPLLALASGLFIARTQDKSWQKNLIISVVLVILAVGVYYNFWQFRMNLKNLPMVLGGETRTEFLSTRVRSFRCFEYLERVTDKNETIVFLYENKGYYLRRPFLADGMYETSFFIDRAVELGSAERFAQWLRSAGIKYILVNEFTRKDLLTKTAQTGFFKDQNLNQRYLQGVKIVEEFIDKFLQKEFAYYGSSVYRLPPLSVKTGNPR